MLEMLIGYVIGWVVTIWCIDKYGFTIKKGILITIVLILLASLFAGNILELLTK